MIVDTRPHSYSDTPLFSGSRTYVQGKFIYAGGCKLYLRGVTYGTFRPDADASEFHDLLTAERDFALMAANGINAVRTYTVPPAWLLDAAGRHGLRVMVGLPWEQHITFLDERARAKQIEERVRAGVRSCAGHPALLGYAIGNEISASIVRWHGARAIERFIERLYRASKEEDPDGLVTYVNYPTTEYLRLPFIDFVSFNVYLERKEELEAYLARLQNIAGDRPLVMSEIGLDSRRNGLQTQAGTLDWQVRTAAEAGAAGMFVFAWTDEWHRGGHDVDDWDFGLTDRERRPKPALEAVRRAYMDVPLPAEGHRLTAPATLYPTAPATLYPRVSVVLCSYNGASTIGESLQALEALQYPDYEVIVVDDGSSDATAAIASRFNCQVISTPNEGLSCARNTGLAASTGEIVAYIDDDAYPDTHWLTYLAASFNNSGHVGMGGPNIAPRGDGQLAACVANAPGNPAHVLLSDREAEHLPGCNMAFRKTALEAIGGFDPRFRVAGDDVDICWRLRERGWTLGFSPAAVVWHHRRGSLRAYWKQQVGYGRAEALLERKWPEKYNAAGHMMWAGRLYGGGAGTGVGARAGRIYGGVWGTAPFQSLYEPLKGDWRSLVLMPDWYLLLALLACVSALGLIWTPLLVAAPLFLAAATALLFQAVAAANRSRFIDLPRTRMALFKARSLTAMLYLLHTLARLRGRLSYGLTPWRVGGYSGFVFPRTRVVSIWSEQWQALEKRLEVVEAALRGKAVVRRGGASDRWDLEVRGGILGAVRLLATVEDHSGGSQMARFRVRPRYAPFALPLLLLLCTLAVVAALSNASAASDILGAVAVLVAVEGVRELSGAMSSTLDAIGVLAQSQAQEKRATQPAGGLHELQTVPVERVQNAVVRER